MTQRLLEMVSARKCQGLPRTSCSPVLRLPGPGSAQCMLSNSDVLLPGWQMPTYPEANDMWALALSLALAPPAGRPWQSIFVIPVYSVGAAVAFCMGNFV